MKKWMRFFGAVLVTVSLMGCYNKTEETPKPTTPAETPKAPTSSEVPAPGAPATPAPGVPATPPVEPGK